MKIKRPRNPVLNACLCGGAVLFVLYLLIHYWEQLAGFGALLAEGVKPLVIGGAMAYLINILMSFIERKLPQKKPFHLPGVRRGIGLAGALVSILGLITLLIVIVVPQFISCIRTLVQKAPAAVRQVLSNPIIASYIPEDWESQLTHINWSTVIEKAVELLRSGLTGGASALSTGFSAVLNVVLGLVFALYILLDKDDLQRQVHKLANAYLPPMHSGAVQKFGRLLNESFHSYVVGQCVEAVILGTLCALGMLLLRLPYAGMIGALVGVTALIPVAGCWIGAFVGAFMILSVSPMKALIFLIFLMILQQLENNLIYPKVVGSSVGLSGMWVLAAVTVGGAVLGVLGMMVSVPLAAAVYRLLREDVSKRTAIPPMPEEETE